MDYKEKYIAALERASKLRVQNPFDTVGQMVEHIFPELKESKDEKTRKEIIDFLELPHPQFVGKRDHEKWLAWLEKQCHMLDPDKVVAWLNDQACQGWIEDVEVDKFVAKFKQDFGL